MFPQKQFFLFLTFAFSTEHSLIRSPTRMREREQAIAYLVDARKQVFTQIRQDCRDGYWNADWFDAWVFLNNAIKHLQN